MYAFVGTFILIRLFASLCVGVHVSWPFCAQDTLVHVALARLPTVATALPLHFALSWSRTRLARVGLSMVQEARHRRSLLLRPSVHVCMASTGKSSMQCAEVGPFARCPQTYCLPSCTGPLSDIAGLLRRCGAVRCQVSMGDEYGAPLLLAVCEVDTSTMRPAG